MIWLHDKYLGSLVVPCVLWYVRLAMAVVVCVLTALFLLPCFPQMGSMIGTDSILGRAAEIAKDKNWVKVSFVRLRISFFGSICFLPRNRGAMSWWRCTE